MQIAYYLEFLGQILPVVLSVAVIFTFFIVQSFGRKLERMAFYLDRIDNHLSEMTYLIKDYQKARQEKEQGKNRDQGEKSPGGSAG